MFSLIYEIYQKFTKILKSKIGKCNKLLSCFIIFSIIRKHYWVNLERYIKFNFT